MCREIGRPCKGRRPVATPPPAEPLPPCKAATYFTGFPGVKTPGSDLLSLRDNGLGRMFKSGEPPSFQCQSPTALPACEPSLYDYFGRASATAYLTVRSTAARCTTLTSQKTDQHHGKDNGVEQAQGKLRGGTVTPANRGEVLKVRRQGR
jgi:hypothetical protein